MDLLNEMTPEEPALAPIKLRILSALIDGIIYFGIGYLIAFSSGMTYNTEGGFGFHLTGLPALLLFLLWIPLMPVNEGLTGQTIGKRIFGIRVVKQDFSKTDIMTSLIRHVFDIIDMIFLVGLIIASSNSKKQRIGDMIAKTFVVMK